MMCYPRFPKSYPLVICYTIENGDFEFVGFPIENGDFP